MSLILNIDTSMENAFVVLGMDESIIGLAENPIQKDHAGFLHGAVKQVMDDCGKQFSELDAIAVTAGPGSYTGIRVGMASAKGLSFALNKPLITINTLELLAVDAIAHNAFEESCLFCPMIDARRMEVYTAIYDKRGKEIVSPTALILDENFNRKFSIQDKLILFGNGSVKCKELSVFKDAIFTENVNIPEAMLQLSDKLFLRKSFTDLIFSEPSYLKEFFNR